MPITTFQQPPVTVHPQREILIAASALHLRVKENPRLFTGEKRNLGQEVNKAVPVRLSPFIMTGKAGQSAQFL